MHPETGPGFSTCANRAARSVAARRVRRLEQDPGAVPIHPTATFHAPDPTRLAALDAVRDCGRP